MIFHIFIDSLTNCLKQQGATLPGCEPRIQSTTTQRGGSSGSANLDHLIGPGGTISISEELYRDLLGQHRKRKNEEPVSHDDDYLPPIASLSLTNDLFCRNIPNWIRQISRSQM